MPIARVFIKKGKEMKILSQNRIKQQEILLPLQLKVQVWPLKTWINDRICPGGILGKQYVSNFVLNS